ncbi:ABC transporter ATP-binding protein [Leucobacter tardus]|uniref:ABC transporter ATP-binding protein n=1 Tax=Leucobacter tardus TaxID=501483 RepID=A0A939QFG0_9MICO|nr:ABC transporter ATP-binding protein [Leucobacter tardus]
MLSADAVSVSRDGVALLEPASLDITAGECIAVRGDNGAGKTTLLRVLAGRLRPTCGTATFMGQPVDERRPGVREAIAALIDPPALYPDLTVVDHLAFIAAAWQPFAGTVSGPCLDPIPVPTPPDQLIAQFGLTAVTNRFPDELSSGQRQLVALAVTFARPARVVLLDEPEQRLDPSRRALLASALRDAGERGIAVVFASHDDAVIASVAQRSVWIEA